MKYAQLIIGLLAGTALGGSVVAATGSSMGAGSAPDAEAVKQIVRDVILTEPQLILDSVQKYQAEQQKKQQAGANEMLKDSAVREEIFHGKNAGSTGPKDSKRVVVEFFDYNCGVCKMMFKNIDRLLKTDKDVRVIFHEYPIFGPASDTNAKIGIAVARLNPEKYFEFHSKMISHEGKVDDKMAFAIIKDLGLDSDKIKAESENKEVADALAANRALGDKLHIQGTPTLVIGDEVVPHAISFEDLEAKLKASGNTSNGNEKSESKEDQND